MYSIYIYPVLYFITQKSFSVNSFWLKMIFSIVKDPLDSLNLPIDPSCFRWWFPTTKNHAGFINLWRDDSARNRLRRISVARANGPISPMLSLADKHALPALCIHAYQYYYTRPHLISSACYIGKYDLFLIILREWNSLCGVKHLIFSCYLRLSQSVIYCLDYGFLSFLFSFFFFCQFLV